MYSCKIIQDLNKNTNDLPNTVFLLVLILYTNTALFWYSSYKTCLLNM